MSTTIEGSRIPYSQRRREAVLGAMPRMALNATDAYVAGVTALGASQARVLPFLNGGLAIAHGAFAIGQLKMAPDSEHDPVGARRAYTMALGEILTAAGFAGLTFGLGLWALPIVAIGELTSNFARFS